MSKDVTYKQLNKELIQLRTQLAEHHLLETRRNWSCGRVKVERRKLDTIINSLPNGVSIISDDYKIQFQNKWLRSIYGNMTGKFCYKTYMHKNNPCESCFIKKAIEHDKLVEGKVTTEDGHCYKLIASPIGKFEGKTSGIEIMIDITQQERAGKLHSRTQQRYEDLINSLNIGVFQTTTDAKGHFLEANPELVSMLEADSKGQLLRHRVRDFYQLHKKRKEIIEKALKFGSVKDEEARWITVKGRQFWASITLVKKEEEDGNVYLDGVIEDITKRKQFEENLQNLSLIDDLTRLNNRRGLFTLASHQLKIAKRHKLKTTLFYIDLDNFKKINDTFGHSEGDKALVAVATILKDTYRESDIIARIGGDEFAVLAVGLGKENADMITARLNKKLEEDNSKALHPYNLSVSIGMANCSYVKSCQIDKLLVEADKSMYEQKLNRKEV
ncbi:MAG: diguanylate cyclase [Candidatus Zapsychrus exili]|nr:diguanylate cyclase [Candidatus Zapsychrus exili]